MKQFSIIIGLAWRNVWRNKRRTILTLLTILVGSSMIVFMNAFAKGGHDQMVLDAVSMNTGEIQIHEKGYWEYRTIDYAFTPNKRLMRHLSDNARIVGYSKRANAEGLLAYKNTTVGAMIQGIDPEQEARVTVLHNRILPGGRYLKESDGKSIIIGYVLARNLGVASGDSLALLSQGYDGSFAADNFTVVGLFNSGNPEYDQGLAIMPLAQFMDTFSMMGNIHGIVIRLTSVSDTDAVRESIRRTIDPAKIEVLGWSELMPELIQFIVMDNASAYIFDFILFVIVAFGVMNTINLSVFERTRELGVMLSIGTSPRQITMMIIVESLFISLLGISLGITAGYGLSYYFHVNPLNYSNYSKEIAVWGVSTTIYPADATLLNITATAGITLILALLFSFLPARRGLHT